LRAAKESSTISVVTATLGVPPYSLHHYRGFCVKSTRSNHTDLRATLGLLGFFSSLITVSQQSVRLQQECLVWHTSCADGSASADDEKGITSHGSALECDLSGQ